MDTHAESSAQSQYDATPPGAGYEHTDARVGIVVRFLVGLAVAAAIIHFGLAALFNFFVGQRVEEAPRRYPLATSEQRQPPEPRLQRFPREDILNFRTGEEQLLQSYGWVDKAAGVVHIPIEDAMKLAIARGLPSRPQTAATHEPPPDFIEAMPSDASGGRVLEPGR